MRLTSIPADVELGMPRQPGPSSDPYRIAQPWHRAAPGRAVGCRAVTGLLPQALEMRVARKRQSEL
jgi:hypothetical protein